MIEDTTTFTISKLNAYIKQKFDNDFVLRKISVRGEISNYKCYPSGHVYFTLKDDSSTLKAVMFYDYAVLLKRRFKDGDEVIAEGRVSVYPARGEYQIYVEHMDLYGVGTQLLELEKLKRKLAAEGLFDESRKKPINIYAHTIGVISAANSAAMADIKTNLLRRNPLLDIKLFPSLVQGEGAAKDLLRALNEAKSSNIDTLIIGRGGGASEDLSAFNDEALVRAVAELGIPTISAVGHEVDVTLIDYVADARASTPTGAAELATFDKREIFQKLIDSSDRLDNIIYRIMNDYRNRLNIVAKFKYFLKPELIFKDKIERIKTLDDKLTILMKHRYELLLNEYKSKINRLEILSPNNTLKRGYSIVETSDGAVIKSVKNININQDVKIKLSDGIIKSKVISKEQENNGK